MEIEIVYLAELETNYIGQSEKERLLKDWEKFMVDHKNAYLFNPIFHKLANRQRSAILMGRRDLLVWSL